MTLCVSGCSTESNEQEASTLQVAATINLKNLTVFMNKLETHKANRDTNMKSIMQDQHLLS